MENSYTSTIGYRELAAISLGFGALMVWLCWPVLSTYHMPIGDLAADMLVGNIIKRDGLLLVGHYSRWEFNHPGPFWFYYNHGFERILDWSNLSRFQIWTLGSLSINVLLAVYSATTLSVFLLREKNPWFILFFLAFMLGYLGLGFFISTGMPDRMVIPYLAFMTSPVGRISVA